MGKNRTCAAVESATHHPSPITHHAGSETILAFDYGKRYVGVAVGDTAVGVAHPLATIDAAGAARRFAAIAEFVREWRPARIVVGLPLSPEGGEQELTGQ